MQLEELHNQNGRPENSRWNKSASIPDDAYSKEARLLLKEALGLHRQMTTDVASIKMSLARLCKPELDDLPDNNKFVFLLEAIDILEFTLGFDHPETGEAYSRMGLAS